MHDIDNEEVDMVTRKKLDDEIVLRREMLKNNYSRASAYYKSAFKDCYKEVVIRGEEISRYMYKRYALDKTEYVFISSIYCLLVKMLR